MRTARALMVELYVAIIYGAGDMYQLAIGIMVMFEDKHGVEQ